jgi:hypothetical protein
MKLKECTHNTFIMDEAWTLRRLLINNLLDKIVPLIAADLSNNVSSVCYTQIKSNICDKIYRNI